MSADGKADHRVAVIVPAAGLSTRFGRNKLHEMVAGKSVLLRTIEAFVGRADTSVLVLTTPPGVPAASSFPSDVNALLSAGASAPIRVSEGGTSRARTVRNALAAIDSDASTPIRWVAVHDAARPLVSSDLIDRAYAHAFVHGSAVPALPVKLTIKQAAGPLPARVIQTVPRQELWEMQTPQVFDRLQLARAYADIELPLDQITDDAQLLELAGQPVWLVNGEERNLKITTPQDLLLAELILRNDPAGGPVSRSGGR